jgi:hypothetical protein
MATLTSAGAIPATATELRDAEVAAATALSPNLTANLPGSLIEDLASTAAGALVQQDQAYVDLVNSISPYSANSFILQQLGVVYGVQQGIGSNTSVYVTFTGLAGFVIPKGFTVSDGNYQYTIQDGGIIGSSGTSPALYCLATTAGSWAVPIGTVTQIITSVPALYTLSCTNLTTGIPGATAQTLSSYQAQVIQAGYATCQGVPNLLRTLLEKVSGVQPRLVSIRNPGVNQWEIICGGGDPYQVADAIYKGMPDFSALVGSTISVTGISSTNPAVVTTDLNHGYTTGQSVTIAGVNPSGFNGTFTATVLTENTFSIPLNATSLTYVSGGIVTPNFRNVTVSVNSYPDTYNIIFVNPPSETVNVTITWNTISTNLISPSSVSQLATPAIVNYINSIVVGQPISTYELQEVFQNAISSILPINQISKIDYAVQINGVNSYPISGTFLIYGDPESYFITNSSLISVVQG